LKQKVRAELVKLLIRKNALVNHLDRNAMAALHKAVIHDRPECIEELMQAKADPNVIYMGDTPLSIAARHNREKICRILCSYAETNVNHRNEQNGTPLHYAAAAIVDDPTCIDFLVHKGAKVNATDNKNNTPLMVSAFFNKPKIMRYLIKQGADVTVRNDEHKDAFDVADEKEHEECREILRKQFEKLGIKKTDTESELSRNFEHKNKISY
jgi:ankyrin repeat protein